MKLQTCECREWLLHCYEQFFQVRIWNIPGPEIDSTYAIVALECRNDVILVPHFVAIDHHDDRQGWPDVQCLSHWCSGSAIKSQIQAPRRPKNDLAPFSTHVDQRIPPLYLLFIQIKIEYL
jgi:hypothetical protein